MIQINDVTYLSFIHDNVFLNKTLHQRIVSSVIDKSLTEKIVESEFRLSEDNQIMELTHSHIFENISEVNYFNNYSFWGCLKKKDAIVAYQYLQIELKYDNGSFVYIYNNKPFTCSVSFDKGIFELCIIHDAPYLHTTWDYTQGQRVSTALHTHPSGTLFKAEFTVYISKCQQIPVLPSFYPNNLKACFVLTDHCDFDTKEKLNLFLFGNNNNGWLNKKLKITKGVFRYGPKNDENRKSDDLEVEEYKKLIDILKKDGSEICPHALKHSGQLSGEEFIQGVAFLQEYCHPRTWIDHGSYLKYCYSQNGHLNDEYKTIDVLHDFKYNNLWSFHDVATDPSLSLNYLHYLKYSKPHGIKMMMVHLFKGNAFYMMHYLRSFVQKAFGKSIVRDLLSYIFILTKSLIMAIAKKRSRVFIEINFFFNRLLRFNSYRSTDKEYFKTSQLNAFLPPFFTENYQTINNYNKGLLFFNTIETTHTKDIYNKASLEALIKERGLHLGHTYILNSLPYINGIFNANGNRLTLSKEWIDFTEVLSEMVANGKIWNPNMGEFVDRIKLMLNVSYRLANNKILIRNNNDEIVEGYTLIKPDNSFYIITLQPHQELILEA
ncbi:MAG: hypothetical protein ACKV1O_25180 [Saprospiraceae bacterium]